MKKNSSKAKRSKHPGLRKAPLASKVISQLRKASKAKVVDIEAIRDAKIKADKLDASIIKKEQMEQLDPLHAVYCYAQNKMSVLVEQLAELPALIRLNNLYADAQDEYMPQGPPISPLTLSYFTCWAFFDLNEGIHKETFGYVATEVCRELQADSGLISLFEAMNASRMGLYIHEGLSEDFVFLRELVTGKRLKANVPSGHKGYQGEMWLARVLPPPWPESGFDYCVVLTTPYVIGKTTGKLFKKFNAMGDEQGWEAYFDRTLSKIKAEDWAQAYHKLMKYGLSRHYWNEYIFEAYAGHTPEMIMLTGFPDIASSRPHASER